MVEYVYIITLMSFIPGVRFPFSIAGIYHIVKECIFSAVTDVTLLKMTVQLHAEWLSGKKLRLLPHIVNIYDQILTNFCVFVISVNVGLVSTWRMMERLVWMLMNAPPLFLVASDVSTLMAPTSACVLMAMKPWSEPLIHAKLCLVSLLSWLLLCRFSVSNCKAYQVSDM